MPKQMFCEKSSKKSDNHDTWKISILMIKKARIRWDFSFKSKKDFKIRIEEPGRWKAHKGRMWTKNNKTTIVTVSHLFTDYQQ
jgi:hypothetical protein